MTNSPPISRRRALGLSAGALLTLGLWPGRTQEPAPGWFRFIVVNDLHYMSEECGTWLEKVIARMQTHAGVEFALVAGDLTEHGRAEHMAPVRDLLAQLKIPVYVLPGNHDYLAQNDRSAYDSIFPERLNYVFDHGDWQFIGLDTTEGLKYQKTEVQPATLAWLDAQLPRLTPRRPTVVFTHFPLGSGVSYRPLNADALLERFLKFNLHAVYSGHFHGFTEREFHGAALTTNKCCALKRGNHDNTTEKGYFLCTVGSGKLTRSFIQVS